ncbi:MAG: DUF4007 family protein [bacterium]|nr:DUF4007 family protein [bacterium]
MMKKNKIAYQRLPVTFHQTFTPERAHIAVLLKYAASGKTGTDQEISTETGIPTGASSGKVPAMPDYCRGMGLLTVERDEEVGQKCPSLTDFGRTVLLEDANLTEELTQWMAHLMLCRRQGGAEVWHLNFGVSYDILGMNFSEASLEEYLTGVLGKRKRSPTGPMLRMYAEPACFKKVGAILQQNRELRRQSAPLLSGFANGYAALLLWLWETHFPKELQVTLTDFEKESYFQRMAGWNEHQFTQILDVLESCGAITLDKQMRPWILSRRAESQNYWHMLYDELA